MTTSTLAIPLGGWLYHVLCPYCGGHHYHAGAPGLRVASCDPTKTYLVQPYGKVWKRPAFDVDGIGQGQ